jgi:hypothetical protein
MCAQKRAQFLARNWNQQGREEVGSQRGRGQQEWIHPGSLSQMQEGLRTWKEEGQGSHFISSLGHICKAALKGTNAVLSQALDEDPSLGRDDPGPKPHSLPMSRL